MARQAAQGAHTAALVGATVEFRIHFRAGNRGRRRLRQGKAPTPIPIQPGCIPRISRLMALAIHFDKLVRQGAVRDYADLARLGGVSRARVSQIMALLDLAPSIQEEILFLPRSLDGRDAVTERQLRGIVAETDWSRQLRLWATICVPILPRVSASGVGKGLAASLSVLTHRPNSSLRFSTTPMGVTTTSSQPLP
jgi:hypothetical protein